MVAQLLGLRLRQLGALFVRPRSRGALIGVGLLLAAGAVAAVIGAVALRDAPDDTARVAAVVAGSFAIVGFLLGPLLLGADDQSDPRRFAVFGIPVTSLAIGLAVGSLASVAGLIILLIAVLTVIAGGVSVAGTIVAIVAAPVAIATCVLALRIVSALAARFVGARRSRELLTMTGFVLLVLLGPAVVLIGALQGGSDGLGAFGKAADIVSWTPFGAVWSLPGDAVNGDWAAVIFKLLVALATLAVLWVVWWALVARLVSSAVRDAPTKTYGGLGWFDVSPANAFGGVSARSFTYWSRDARYWVPVIIIPLVPFLMMPPLALAGVSAHALALLPLPFIVTILGWTLHNDVALDSSALWLHVSSGASGHADRWGRNMPVLLIGIPVIVIGSALTALFYGEWGILPAVVGVSTCLFFTAVGVSSFAAVRFPYPAVQPGDSPFQQPQSAGSGAIASQALSLFLAIVLSGPAIAAAVTGIVTGSSGWFMTAFVVGLAVGVFVLLVGTAAAAVAYRRRGPELMIFATGQ